MTEREGAWETAARLSSGMPQLALIVVPEDGDVALFADELRTDLVQLSSAEVADVVVRGPWDVEHAVTSSTQILLRNMDVFTEADWRALDRARSRLRPRSLVVLVLGEATAKRLVTYAPGLASWLAGSTYYGALEAEPRDAQQGETLRALRTHYAMTDEQALALAERREPPSDEPDFAVWLVLLGRGDLVLGSRS